MRQVHLASRKTHLRGNMLEKLSDVGYSSFRRQFHSMKVTIEEQKGVETEVIIRCEAANDAILRLAAMLVGKRYEQNADTIRLNEGLRTFQK